MFQNAVTGLHHEALIIEAWGKYDANYLPTLIGRNLGQMMGMTLKTRVT